jgi:hypothetical protein
VLVVVVDDVVVDAVDVVVAAPGPDAAFEPLPP